MAIFYDGSKYLTEEQKKIIKERKKASNKAAAAQVRDALIAAGIVVGLNATIVPVTLMGGLFLGAASYAGVKTTKFIGREIKKHKIKKRENPSKDGDSKKLSKESKSLIIHSAMAASCVALPSFIFGVGPATIVGAGVGSVILAKDLIKLGVNAIRNKKNNKEETTEKTR